MSMYRNSVWLAKGLREFTKGGFDRASANFDEEDLNVDLTGRTAIVTGANSGIGKKAAQAFFARGGRVHMLCRDREKGERARTDILVTVGIADASHASRLILHVVDVSRPQQLVEFVEGTLGSEPLHVLINNAGCLLSTYQETPEGIERSWATNTLAVYVLTKLLVHRTEAPPPERVITVSSGGMLVQRLASAQDGFFPKRPERWDAGQSVEIDGMMAYAQQKRQQVTLTNLWASEYASKVKTRFLTCHPGWADTAAVRESMPNFYQRMRNRLRSVEEGADTIIWLAVAPDAVIERVPSGSFVQDRRVVPQHLPMAWTAPDAADVTALVETCERFYRQACSASASVGSPGKMVPSPSDATPDS